MHPKQFQKSKVFTISFAHFSHDVYTSFLAPLLPLLIEKLGISLSTAALLNIITRIPSLFNPFFGLMAEKTGVKYFVILTPAMTAICMSLIGLAPSLGVLFILLFVTGISTALFHVPSPTMVKESSGDKTGTGMSYFMVGGELARTVGPLLVTAGVSWWGLEGIYRLMPLGLLASLILYIKLKDFDTDRPIQKAKEKGDGKKLLYRYRYFFLTMGAFLFFQAGMKSALTLFLPVYLTQQGASLWYAGISLSLLQFFGILGTSLSGNLSDRIGRRPMLLIGSIGAVVSMGFFAMSSHIFLLIPLGLFLFTSGPVLMATVQDTDSNMPTFMNSIYMTINFALSSLVVFVVGLMGDNLGLDQTYLICSIFAIGCIPMAYLLTSKPKNT